MGGTIVRLWARIIIETCYNSKNLSSSSLDEKEKVLAIVCLAGPVGSGNLHVPKIVNLIRHAGYIPNNEACLSVVRSLVTRLWARIVVETCYNSKKLSSSSLDEKEVLAIVCHTGPVRSGNLHVPKVANLLRFSSPVFYSLLPYRCHIVYYSGPEVNECTKGASLQ